MGRASADQLDGVNFKSSTNLYSLPQIVNINQSVDVNPFWGQPEVCQINIARKDFDLKSVGINIVPSAIFMGSLVTGIDDESVEKNCKPPRDMGNLCNLSVGPGEIISVRQTIRQDVQGRPILEQGTLPQGGKVIDGDGTWVVDVPMNLNYVTTNEFGEQIFSQDPTVGIPTKGKYRFKVKYTQPTNFETQEVRRGYFLVPNIKEYGWTDDTSDPAYIVDTNDQNYKKFVGSYYFGVDWSGYTNQADAIACKDTFYEMDYNKVYTVAQHYDEYKKGTNRSKFIGIKEITDTQCASENNRFPATDGVESFDLIFFIVSLLLSLSYYAFLVLIPLVHLLSLIWPVLKLIIVFVVEVIGYIVYGVCEFLTWFGYDGPCNKPPNIGDLWKSLDNPFQSITLPNMSYPDCQFCDCKPQSPEPNKEQQKTLNSSASQTALQPNAKFFSSQNWIGGNDTLENTFAGKGTEDFNVRTPIYPTKFPTGTLINFVNNLPIWETINKFNLKSKYFDSDVYPGSNRIKVSVEPTLNPNTSHFDNVVVFFVDPVQTSSIIEGQLLSFQEIGLSKDPNPKVPSNSDLTGITGSTIQGKSITINYANPSSPVSQLSATYVLNGSPTSTPEIYKFPSDLEYFQVIKKTTYSDFISQNSKTLSSRLLNQIDEQVKLFYLQGGKVEPYVDYLENWVGGGFEMIFMVRGVDPHSGRKKIKYDLSRIYGYNTWGNVEVSGDFYLNIPIQPGLRNVSNNLFTTNLENHNGNLYFESYTFDAGPKYSPYTTTLQQYYSSLDQTQINSFKPSSTNPNTMLVNQMINIGTSGELLAKKFTPTGVGYKTDEYIDGGSYIYYSNNFTVAAVDGDNNNGVIPYIYFAPKYASTNMVVYSQKLVMRSDRLPTGTQPQTSGNNTFAGQSSQNLTYSLVSPKGASSTKTTAQGAGGQSATANPDITGGGNLAKVIDSFSCNGMVDLNCYTNQNDEFSVLPSNNSCNTNDGGKKVVDYGCYVLINEPLTTLFGKNNDFDLLSQWLFRFRMTFGVCRGVLSHTFVNSWVNGTLFAFPFTSKVFFDKNNKPFNREIIDIGPNKFVNYLYCGRLLVFEPNSNSFYYRSSPFDGTNFVGAKQTSTPFLNEPVNDKNILFPTTIMDMGPKYIWQSEVNKSPNYYGYQMNRFNSTTWNDDSNLINIFTISRLLNSSFLTNLFGGVSALFSRKEDRVDGDFAQMLQINSQYGITPFTAENYPDDTNVTGDNPVYVGFDKDKGPLFGIFYSGNSVNRDLVSPRRIDRTFTGSTTTLVADYLGTKSQVVPYYKWRNTTWIEGQPTIFGSQDNSWFTYDRENVVESSKYQELDRRLTPFFQGNNNLLENAYGYVYQRDNKGKYILAPSSLPNNGNTLTSGPWYFYFGLKKGKSAMDKYVQQYLGTETNV